MARFAGPVLIAAKDLRQRLRDRSMFLYGLVAPFGLAFIFSLLLSPIESGPRPEIGLVDEDGSLVSSGLRTALAAADRAGALNWQGGLGPLEAQEQVESGIIDAAIVVPEGFGPAVTSGAQTQLTVLGNVDSSLSARVAESVANAYASRLRSTSLAVQGLIENDLPVPPLPVLALQAAGLPEPLSLKVAQTSSRQLGPTTYYAAGMAVFFVFFIVQVGVTGLLDEERNGTMARLLVAPIPRSSILAGKILTSVVLGVASMAVLAIASSLLMGANWGDPVAAAALIVAVVLAAAGILSLVAGLARTPEAAGNLQSIAAITLAALGGAFFQLSTGNEVLGFLTQLTPHHWFLRGVGDLAAGGGMISVLDEIGRILAFGLVAGFLGWWLLERRLRR